MLRAVLLAGDGCLRMDMVQYLVEVRPCSGQQSLDAQAFQECQCGRCVGCVGDCDIFPVFLDLYYIVSTERWLDD
jgi:hypothetical protein